jgi:hypothetical protein
MVAPVLREKSCYALNLTADRDTAAALDAFFHVTHKSRCRIIDMGTRFLALKGKFADAEFKGEGLEFAIFAPDAHLTVTFMFADEKFDDCFSGFADTFGICLNLHAVCDRGRAGGLEIPSAFNLYNADPAASHRFFALEITERRDPDLELIRRIQNGRAGCDFSCPVIDRDFRHDA